MLAAPRILNAPATCMFSHFSSNARWGLDVPCTRGVRRATPRMRSTAAVISARVTSGSEASTFMGSACASRAGHSAADARENETHMELTDRLVAELIDSVKQVLKREASERLREVYLVGDIEKDSARHVIERMRELANDNPRPITLYLNTAGGNVTDGL